MLQPKDELRRNDVSACQLKKLKYYILDLHRSHDVPAVFVCGMEGAWKSSLSTMQLST